jgi:Mor family transcriptional regulator
VNLSHFLNNRPIESSKKTKRAWPADQNEELKSLVNQGVKIPELMKHFNCSESAIRNKLQILKVSTKGL